MENVAILARVPSALRQCAALCAELNHRALRDTLILNSPFSIFHYFDRLQISTVFLDFRFLIDR